MCEYSVRLMIDSRFIIEKRLVADICLMEKKRERRKGKKIHIIDIDEEKKKGQS